MALESLPKIAPALFSAEQDLIQIYNKKSDTTGVINPSYIKSSPSGVAGAIQFSDGSAFASDASNLFWDDTNNRLGVGTNAPTNTFEIASTTTAPFKVATTAAYFRSSYKAGASTGLFDFIDGPGFSFPLDNVQFGTSGALGAKVGIKGSGSTSATTSLLVQNSAATQIFKVQDDGQVFVNQGNQQVTFTGAGGISRIQAPNEMTIGIGASFNAMKVYYDGRVGLQNDAVYISSGNLGIGTTSPSAKLNIVDNAGGTGNALLISHPTAPATLAYNPNASALILSGGYSYLAINTFGGGSNALTLGSGGPHGYLDLKENGTTYTYLTGTSTGNAGYSYFLSQLGVGTATTLGAKLSIKGSGSTSATTSLLVQNSNGTEAFKVTDDRSVTISGGTTTISSPKTFINGISTTTAGFGDTGYGMAITNGITFAIDQGVNQGYNFGWWYGLSSVGAWNNASRNCVYIGMGAYTPNINNITFTSLNMSPTFNCDFASRSGNIVRGIYYNPTITSFINGVSNQLRAFESSIGGVFINTSSVDASAILQADSVTQGFLPPRMTDAQIRAIASPANGLVAYNTDINHLCCYQNGAWAKFSHSPM